MNTHTVMDQHHGLPVFTFQFPPNWQAQSRVEWNFHNTAHAVTVSAATYKGLEGIDFWPVDSFFWLEPGLTAEGHVKLGQICWRPRPAVRTLLEWVLPKYRGGRTQLRVVVAGPMDELPAMLSMNLGSVRHESAGLKIEYVESDQWIEEEFYGVVTYQQNGSQTNWGLTRLHSFRAPRGRLEEVRPLFWDVVRSSRPNPAFEQLCTQIYQQLALGFQLHLQAGYQQIEMANQLGRGAAAHRREIGQQQQQRFDHVMRSAEPSGVNPYSISEARGDELMGRLRYDDPSAPGGVSYHDGHPERVWTDGQNHYQSSQDPNFDPNLSSNRTWTELKPSQLKQGE